MNSAEQKCTTLQKVKSVSAKDIVIHPKSETRKAVSSATPEPPATPAEPASPSSNIITVVRDPYHTLGKTFSHNPDGTISKKAGVNLSFGIAIMYQVDTPNELACLMEIVGKNPNKAIINASFKGVEVGEEFIILSSAEIERRLGIKRGDRDRQKGVHEIQYEGKTYKAVGRFKENVRPSSWQFFDRDVDKHTPEKFRNQTFEEWLSSLAAIVLGLADVSYCRVGSTSARVCLGGKPVGDGNGHLWVMLSNPEDVERFRTAILLAAAEGQLTWKKPRYSRQNQDQIVGYSLATIIDPSVFTLGRLIFVGQPVVNEGLTVEPMTITIHNGEKGTIDTTLVSLPTKEKIREITKNAGVEMEVSNGEEGLRITVKDLTLDTELETKDHGVMTVREYLEQGFTGKIRCQTPFRESSSFAAFISKGQDGKPFVYDSGTSTTHWLNDSDNSDVKIAFATGIIKDVLEKAKEDNGAPFEPEALAALKTLKKFKPAEYQRKRTEFKELNKNISVVELDKAVKNQSVHAASEENDSETHYSYANAIIAELTVDGWPPVCYEGELYVLDSKEKIWVKYPLEKVVGLVPKMHDGKTHCARKSDYHGIASLVLMIVADDKFFKDAPIGLACPNGFYQIENDQIKMVPLSPEHRQRVKISVNPEDVATPLFVNFLHETFQSKLPDEEAQQIRLLQEIAGAIMIGCMHKFHKAVLFYDAFGRAGKGTLERILSMLVPESFVRAVSPFNWDKEYYLASLVSARLNVVGELQDDKTIPSAAFKTVTGGDLLSGRHPNHRPISFKNEAAHLFMSNHLINTKDHSEAFFTRWLLVEFPNSRLRLGLSLDTGLADRIIEQELAGIAYWALIGAKRLLTQGKFSSSIVHERLMAKWRRNTSSLEEFIHECCERGAKLKVRRAEFYQEYKEWCGENGRKAFSKSKVKELLEHNLGLGISHTTDSGYEIFKGVEMKKEIESDVTRIEPSKKW